MKNRIRLDTYHDAASFVNITTHLNGKITVHDGDDHCVNAKSLMGMLYALEFNELWVESDNDIYFAIKDFIVNE